MNVPLLATLVAWILLQAFFETITINCDRSTADVRDYRVVYPQIDRESKRTRRDLSDDVYYEREDRYKIVNLRDGDGDVGPILELQFDNNLLIADGVRVQWMRDDGRIEDASIANCEYASGAIRGVGNSRAIVTLCDDDEINGYFGASGEIHFVEPLNSTGNRHVLYRASLTRGKRSMGTYDNVAGNYYDGEQWEYFNLTGDVIDIGRTADTNGTSPNRDQQESVGNNDANERRVLHREELDADGIGYFYDSAWETNTYSGFVRAQKNQSTKKRRWIEIAIGVDYSVISFHGRHNVEKYVLSLMNIVNGIFQDASLDANVQLVITRLLFYETKKHSLVQRGNATKSLLNVNHWNRRLHASLAPGEPVHDLAIWLTRNDIGGPSGYAPLAGVCDSNRSCSLNRDEGLSSAFIIAHEMGHILGLSHDGDKKSGNDCVDESRAGSIMAPLVTATFNKFLWSDCSRRELQQRVNKWQCLSNAPEVGAGTYLNTTLGYEFTLDEQCRMEFGKGYVSCRSFEITEPCTHLWCEKDRSLMCKTKKGPPVEGTQCGFNKWCINEYCQNIDMHHRVRQVLHLNPINGGWSEWTAWTACSRTCGIGVEFRTRNCNQPEPMYGGDDCNGTKEEWRICKRHECPEPLADVRAQQCRNIPDVLRTSAIGLAANITLMPYESEIAGEKCKLICTVKETGELYKTEDNLIDGTPCSYERGSDVCIQGECHPLGCDGVLHSHATEDDCGVCDGNNDACEHVVATYRKRLKRDVSKIARIPRMTRNIRVDVNVTFRSSDASSGIVFVFKERKKRWQSSSIAYTFDESSAIVVEGTKFRHRKRNDGATHEIWGRGPLLSEMFLLIQSTGDANKPRNVTVQTAYDIDKSLTNGSARFQWIVGGWGPCSSSCGGGKRAKTIACFDKRNNKIAPRRKCAFVAKPKVDAERCNTFNCTFNWVPGAWEPCSATCGSLGVQRRELYCVPYADNYRITFGGGGGGGNANATTYALWRTMVNPRKCVGMQPSDRKPCNRVPCPSNWEYRDWSQCSESCGSGISTRQPHCPPPGDETFFSCGAAPRVRKRKCRGPYRRGNRLCGTRKRRDCVADQTVYCELPILARYCKSSGFRRVCCKSCANHRRLNPVIAGVSD